MRHIRTAALVTLLALVLVASAACSSPQPSAPSTPSTPSSPSSGSSGGTAVTVSMENFAFSPATIDVAVGTTVTFTNKDSAQHDVAGDGWKSPLLSQGQSYSRTFDTAGTFPIGCTIHPSMTGKVVVK